MHSRSRRTLATLLWLPFLCVLLAGCGDEAAEDPGPCPAMCDNMIAQCDRSADERDLCIQTCNDIRPSDTVAACITDADSCQAVEACNDGGQAIGCDGVCANVEHACSSAFATTQQCLDTCAGWSDGLRRCYSGIRTCREANDCR